MVAYGVVPPLFGSDHPLEAVTDQLDELDRLGVDALWLSPIQATDDEGQISYGSTDYFSIREDFGSPEDLKKLVHEAHERGMKVLLDFAPNHVSVEHEFYQDVLDRGTESPYYDWFDRDENGNVTCYFDWDNLINLNYSNPDVQKLVTDAFEHWVKEYDVDGYRVDAAWGPAERNPQFWGKLNERLKALKPDIFLLAEAGARDPYYVENGFDAAYDWGETIGRWSWADVFDKEDQIGRRLHEALTAASGTPPGQVARFINNNDTEDRFISRYGATKTRAAATLLLTLPGLPIVYTGDEVGAEFRPYDDPPPLSWKDPHKLRPHYQKLIALRESEPSLAHGDWQPVAVKGSGAAFAFVRRAEGADPVLVVVNFGGAAKLQLDRPEGFEGPALQDLLGGGAISAADPDLRLTLPPGGSVVLTPPCQGSLMWTASS